MNLTISLPPDAEHTLQERARAAGLDATTYASQLLQNSLRPPRTLQELSGQVYQRFLASGITDDQLGDELEQAKHEMREERRPRQAS
jgi:hypothetical protein